jgi:peptidoglycan hydrolase-like protein with peptidoglycan-binding domain
VNAPGAFEGIDGERVANAARAFLQALRRPGDGAIDREEALAALGVLVEKTARENGVSVAELLELVGLTVAMIERARSATSPAGGAPR